MIPCTRPGRSPVRAVHTVHPASMLTRQLALPDCKMSASSSGRRHILPEGTVRGHEANLRCPRSLLGGLCRSFNRTSCLRARFACRGHEETSRRPRSLLWLIPPIQSDPQDMQAHPDPKPLRCSRQGHVSSSCSPSGMASEPAEQRL